jgi:F0F1-type ATP synthase delta subunit
LAEPIDVKEKKFKKDNYFQPEQLSSANESVINTKNVNLIINELVKDDKHEAFTRLSEYKTIWGKRNFVNLLTVAAVNGHTEALEEFFSFVNKNTKNRKDNNK